MTSVKTIKAAILSAITNSITKVQETHGYEKSTFDGFPAAVVVPTSNESDYGSTRVDRFVFIFRVKIYYLIQKESDHEAAENALIDVVDEFLTVFNNRNVLGIADGWVEPVPGIFEYEVRDSAVYRVAEITLRCINYV